MQQSFDEGRHATEGLLSEANGARSRKSIVIAAGAAMVLPCMALGAMYPADTLSISVTADAGNTGDGTITLADPAFGPATIPGDYRIVCVDPAADAGAFVIEDPNGNQIGTADAGAAFASDHLNFTINDGAADFVAGDAFTVSAAATGDPVYVPCDPAATDGSQIARAVALYPADATDGPITIAAIVRDAEFAVGAMEYAAAVDTDPERNAILADLAKAGIIVR